MKTWEPETVTRWFRLSNLWDGVQEKLFGLPDPKKSEALVEARRTNPGVPWDLLRQESYARRAAEEYADENSGLGNTSWQPPDEIIPAEVWPRVPFCTFEFPENLLKRIRKTNTYMDVRRARLIRLREEVEKAWEKEWGQGIKMGWAEGFRRHMAKKLKEVFEEEKGRPSAPVLQDAAQLAEWARGDNLNRRWEAARHPSLPGDVQAELSAHWDFATRLSLATNSSLAPPIFKKLANDVQPNVRAVITARLQRKTFPMAPLIGEILTPGEILWLLVAHPGTFFEFGSATYGDGSEAYARWGARRGAEGSREYWAYFGGLLFESGERGLNAFHVALHGLSFIGCGRHPCMYLGKTYQELTIQSKPTLFYRSGGSDSF